MQGVSNRDDVAGTAANAKGDGPARASSVGAAPAHAAAPGNDSASFTRPHLVPVVVLPAVVGRHGEGEDLLARPLAGEVHGQTQRRRQVAARTAAQTSAVAPTQAAHEQSLVVHRDSARGAFPRDDQQQQRSKQQHGPPHVAPPLTQCIRSRSVCTGEPKIVSLRAHNPFVAMARTSSALMMSMGTVSMWGFSPAFDVCSGLAECGQSKVNSKAGDGEEKASTKPINVLLAGPGDVRHVLATIARRRRWDPAMKRRPVHIYLFESAIETLSRDLLLLQVALDTDLPLRQRCNSFLEIFGNARVQERTSAYIEEQAKLLMDFVYNDRGPLAGLVDLSHLKMRTHDDMIDTFRSWFQSVKFDGKIAFAVVKNRC
ncbi:unnamed protein product [Phytophthora lilii]|uniref:Unnamed protein product n=1 Tax=Phytophthora lilii TaxID=2077276 RepID=A0A9W6WQ10_9STRA|nr:unnamed protein product [Phytophthora lilii]